MLIDFNFAKIWKHPDRPPLTGFACSTVNRLRVKTHLVRIYYIDIDRFYIALFSALEHSLRLHVILHEWIAFHSAFLNIHRSGILTALAWLVPQESAARESQSRRVQCTPYNHAPCHFMQSHIRKVYACLAVTCHLRFWQNDRGLLRATAVTRGWNGYRNKSQHRKLTLKKKINPPLQQGFESATFRSRVRRSNHWAIPAPLWTGHKCPDGHIASRWHTTNSCINYQFIREIINTSKLTIFEAIFRWNIWRRLSTAIHNPMRVIE